MDTTFIAENQSIENKNKESWGTRWEPRTKIVTSFIGAVIIISFKTPYFLTILFLTLLFILWSMGFTMKKVFSKLLFLFPFLFLMGLPILFSGGLTIELEKATFVANIMLKSFTAALLIMMMVLSQPLPQLLNGLSNMKLPASLISILILAINYTKMLYRTLMLFQKALLSRLFRPSTSVASIHIFSCVIAGFVLKSFDQSDKIYQAMVARGFSSKIPTAKPSPITKVDVFKSLFLLFLFTLILFMEMWWLS